MAGAAALSTSNTDGDFLLDTGWACGWIRVKDGRVVQGAPIFKRLVGQEAKTIFSRYKRYYRLAITRKEVES